MDTLVEVLVMDSPGVEVPVDTLVEVPVVDSPGVAVSEESPGEGPRVEVQSQGVEDHLDRLDQKARQELQGRIPQDHLGNQGVDHQERVPMEESRQKEEKVCFSGLLSL